MFEEGAAIRVCIRSQANPSTRVPCQSEAREVPFAREGPAPPFLPIFADSGARFDGLRFLDGTPIMKVEEDGRAARLRVTKGVQLPAGGGFRLSDDCGGAQVRACARPWWSRGGALRAAPAKSPANFHTSLPPAPDVPGAAGNWRARRVPSPPLEGGARRAVHSGKARRNNP